MTSWDENIPLEDMDDMSMLVFKLKILKGKVKSWEKSQKNIRPRLLQAVDKEFIVLLEASPSGILSKAEISLLSPLKSKKEKLCYIRPSRRNLKQN